MGCLKARQAALTKTWANVLQKYGLFVFFISSSIVCFLEKSRKGKKEETDSETGTGLLKHLSQTFNFFTFFV
jgi:hypothetical protein